MKSALCTVMHSPCYWKFYLIIHIMHGMNNLRGIDLNLLVVLEALLAERHVTRTATRLAMSQPAVSHALARLRTLLDDPLLERAPGGLRPTPRALALTPVLSESLALARRVVGQGAFAPSESRRHFRMSMSDYGTLVVLPRLIHALRRLAPGVTLDVVQLSRESAAARVRDGMLDLALGVFPVIPTGVVATRLFVERFVCVGDRRHRAFRGGLTLARYCAAPHALVAVRGLGGGDALNEIDTALAAIGRTRRVVTVWPHFLPAPRLVLGTDLLLTIAERSIAEQAPDPALAVHELPFEVAPFSFVAVHQPDALEDEGRAWLMQQVITASRAAAKRRPKR